MNAECVADIILGEAIDKLRQATGLVIKAFPATQYPPEYDMPDMILHVGLPEGNMWQFPVVIKKGVLQQTNIGLIARQLDCFPEPGILVAGYVPPGLADELKELNLQFLDTAGNVFLNVPPLYVFIKGNKLAEMQHPEPLGRAFRPAGLRVIFVLLCEPKLEEVPLREIARVAKVALGTVNIVMKDLAKQGYLLEMGRVGRRLTRKKDLLERWLTAYPEQLRHKQVIGRYRIAGNDKPIFDIDIQVGEHYQGGEIAAARMTGYLKPQIATIYVTGPPGKLILRNRMQKDPHGNIEILETFWDHHRFNINDGMVPPLLVYADLLATGDPRNLETAKIIYEQTIVRLIEEN
jgi:hypothetical protein